MYLNCKVIRVTYIFVYVYEKFSTRKCGVC